MAGWPLTVSPVKALAAAVAPLAPLMFDAASLVATTGDGSTITVIVLGEQFAGLRFSQIL